MKGKVHCRVDGCVCAILKNDFQVMSEILAGIRVIKFYAWEKCFMDRIHGYRLGGWALVHIYVHTLQIDIQYGL